MKFDNIKELTDFIRKNLDKVFLHRYVEYTHRYPLPHGKSTNFDIRFTFDFGEFFWELKFVSQKNWAKYDYVEYYKIGEKPDIIQIEDEDEQDMVYALEQTLMKTLHRN